MSRHVTTYVNATKGKQSSNSIDLAIFVKYVFRLEDYSLVLKRTTQATICQSLYREKLRPFLNLFNRLYA